MVGRPVEIGLLLHTRFTVGSYEAFADFGELWEYAERAEQMGFDHVWLGSGVVTSLERPGADSLTTMAAVATRTGKVRIGVIPFWVALWNPILLAQALATLDAISCGRILLGTGVGPLAEHMERAFNACGVPYHEKAGRLTEYINIMRRLWTEKTVAFQGKYYQFDDIGVLPRPFQRSGIPIWITAGKNENALRRVARIGDGWLSSQALEEFLESRQKIESYADSFGRKDRPVPAALYGAFNLNSNSDTAREEGWAFMERFFRQPRSKQSHLTFFGTPQECVKALRRYKDAGLKLIIARLASDNRVEQMERLLGEVTPRLMVLLWLWVYAKVA